MTPIDPFRVTLDNYTSIISTELSFQNFSKLKYTKCSILDAIGLIFNFSYQLQVLVKLYTYKNSGFLGKS